MLFILKNYSFKKFVERLKLGHIRCDLRIVRIKQRLVFFIFETSSGPCPMASKHNPCPAGDGLACDTLRFLSGLLLSFPLDAAPLLDKLMAGSSYRSRLARDDG